jgi:tetratricopeptide (TPR) repeat protein
VRKNHSGRRARSSPGFFEEDDVAAAKKKSRKELLKEPDPVLTWSSRLFGLAAQYKNAVFYGVIGLLLVAALFSGYRLYASREEAKAAVLLAESLTKYERLKKDQPQAKAVQEVAEDFKRIFTSYANRSNGNIARLAYANMCYEAGDFTQAAEHYKATLSRFDELPMIRFQILKSLGYASEGLKDHAGAARYFEAALIAGDKRLLDDVLFELGDLYAKLGEKEKSAEAFKRILSDHKDSVYLELARERVSG